MDILLIGWWGGNWELASSTFWFVLVWGLRACGQHAVNFSHLMGVSVSAKQLRDIVLCIPWGGTRTLPQGCAIVSWLFLLCFCIPSLPWLATVWKCPLELREGLGGWMKPISCNQRMRDTERLLCPGAPRLDFRRLGGDSRREVNQLPAMHPGLWWLQVCQENHCISATMELEREGEHSRLRRKAQVSASHRPTNRNSWSWNSMCKKINHYNPMDVLFLITALL